MTQTISHVEKTIRDTELPDGDTDDTLNSRASIVFALMQRNLPDKGLSQENRTDFIDVIKKAEFSTFQEGATITSRGCPLDQLYVILEGSALGSSHEGQCSMFQKGSIIGQSSLITGQPSDLTVVAGNGGVTLLAIDRDSLIRSPVVYRGLLGTGLVISGSCSYELGEKLGEGFNGPVYELQGHRLCAKIYRPRFDSGKAPHADVQPSHIQQLSHPYIVGLKETISAHGAQFIIMDMVSGISIKRNNGESVRCRSVRQMMDVFHDEQQRVSLEMTARIFRHAATALLYIHEQGLVHRDVKPEHIFIDICDNEIAFKLSDFSLAFPISTRPGKIVGTPHYCPPEAIIIDRPEAVITGSADFYSLGAVCFELLTAQKVFDCANLLELAQQHLDAAPDLSRLPSSTPIWLGKFIEQSLHKDPSKRPGREEIEKFIAVSQPGV